MPEETVVLKVFATEIDAKMARDVLNDEGITALFLRMTVAGWNLICSVPGEFVW